MNKMNKTFVDNYLLAQYEQLQKAGSTFYTDIMLSCIDDINTLMHVGAFERCCVIEFTFAFGNAEQ